jgi:hypothetical protein
MATGNQKKYHENEMLEVLHVNPLHALHVIVSNKPAKNAILTLIITC